MHKNILVAEDDKNIANLIKELIKRKGNNAILATDGEEAFKLFSSVKVDLIITDLKMPHIDGMTLIKMIREKNKSIPIIIITGYGSEENRNKANLLGVSTILQKPCSIIDISNAIESVLNISAP